MRNDSLRRFYPWLLASDVVILLCVAVIGLAAPDRWNGVYLVWGILCGLVLVLLYLGATTYVGRILARSGKALSPARAEQMRLRNRIVVPGCITFGVAWGALSAIFDTPIPLLFFGGMVVLFFVIPWAIGIPLILRRGAASSPESDAPRPDSARRRMCLWSLARDRRR